MLLSAAWRTRSPWEFLLWGNKKQAFESDCEQKEKHKYKPGKRRTDEGSFSELERLESYSGMYRQRYGLAMVLKCVFSDVLYHKDFPTKYREETMLDLPEATLYRHIFPICMPFNFFLLQSNARQTFV